jgi:two-component sensor histidine kinase
MDSRLWRGSPIFMESSVSMPIEEIVHVINNQLTIVMGKAALLASSAEDQSIKSGCAEIETAVQKISSLINRIPIKT